jgi:hypothetical protein
LKYMNIIRKNTLSYVLVLLLTIQAVQGFVGVSESYANTEKLQVSPGVVLNKERVTDRASNLLDINLLDPYTTIQVGMPNPLTKLTTTSTLARLLSAPGNTVVGAVNGSFFHLDSGLPSYLIAQNNQLVNLGAISNNNQGYMHTPAAFGVTSTGKGLIDRFNVNVSITHSGKTHKLSSFNVERGANQSILYTPAYRYANTRTNQFGLEVVVSKTSKSADSGAMFGEAITGTVSSIRSYGELTSAAIPKDGYVISAIGTAVDQIRGLKIGDEVSLSYGIDPQWQNASFMLASGPLLVQKGKVQMTMDEKSPRNLERAPRSAVATDATGSRVFFVTVDGRQPGFSRGMTLKEFANYLVSVGAYQALNLDGGGSTTMVARMHGEQYPTLINSPSDGRERGVSTILAAVSTAPVGEPTYLSAKQATPGKIVKGSSVGFNINYVLDQYYSPLPISSTGYTLTVEGGIGSIVDNKFVAEKAGTGNVIMNYGAAKAKFPITVVESPTKLQIQPTQVYTGKGKTQKLTVKALDEAGKELIFNQGTVNWSVSGNIGTIDQTGTFTSGLSEATGSITATVGKTTVTIPVTVSDQPYLLSSMDSLTGWKTENIRAKSTIALAEKGTLHEGTGAIKLSYDFTGSTTGTTASYLVSNSLIELPGKPSGIGVWVYGDAKNHWLRGKVRDGSGKEITIDFTKEAGLDWNGWRYVEAALPDSIKLPVKFERIYVAEPLKSKQGKGAIYFDKLQATYSKEYKELYFKPNTHTVIVDPAKTWTVEFNTPLKASTVTKNTIYVEDQEGVRQNVSVTLDPTGKFVKVIAPQAKYTGNSTAYRLVVTKAVQSDKGIPMATDHKTVFKVN